MHTIGEWSRWWWWLDIYVSDVEDVGIFDDNVIHVNGVELGEVGWKRDKINGRGLVELEEISAAAAVVVFVVSS